MINKIWNNFLELDKVKDKKWFKTLNWFIKNEYQDYYSPRKENIFNMFKLLNPDEITGVFMFQDPYPQKKKNKEPIANGIGLSAPYLTSSLKHFYLAIDNNYDLDNADITMMKFINQGIFCINKYLSVGKEPMSHSPINLNINGEMLRWDLLMKIFIEKLNSNYKNIFYVFFGKEAQEYSSIINKDENLVINTSHPSPSGFRYGLMDSDFAKKINEYLIKNNKKQIIWK